MGGQQGFDLTKTIFQSDPLFSGTGDTHGVFVFGQSVKTSRRVAVDEEVLFTVVPETVVEKVESVADVEWLVGIRMLAKNKAVLLQQTGSGVVFQEPQRCR